EQVRDAAGELHDLQAARDLAERVAVHLAVFGGDQRRQLVAVRVHQLPVPEQHLGPLDQGRVAPGGERLRGGGDGRVHVRDGRHGDGAAHLPGRRVVDLGRTGIAVDESSADPVLDCLHCCAASALMTSSALTMMPRPSVASSTVSVSGGAMRMAVPFSPPLPTSRPPFLVSSMNRAVWAGVSSSTANIRPLPRTSLTTGSRLAASRSPSMMILPVFAALAWRSWSST